MPASQSRKKMRWCIQNQWDLLSTPQLTGSMEPSSCMGRRAQERRTLCWAITQRKLEKNVPFTMESLKKLSRSDLVLEPHSRGTVVKELSQETTNYTHPIYPRTNQECLRNLQEGGTGNKPPKTFMLTLWLISDRELRPVASPLPAP